MQNLGNFWHYWWDECWKVHGYYWLTIYELAGVIETFDWSHRNRNFEVSQDLLNLWIEDVNLVKNVITDDGRHNRWNTLQNERYECIVLMSKQA